MELSIRNAGAVKLPKASKLILPSPGGDTTKEGSRCPDTAAATKSISFTLDKEGP